VPSDEGVIVASTGASAPNCEKNKPLAGPCVGGVPRRIPFGSGAPRSITVVVRGATAIADVLDLRPTKWQRASLVLPRIVVGRHFARRSFRIDHPHSLPARHQDPQVAP